MWPSISWATPGRYEDGRSGTDRRRFVEWREAGEPNVCELYDHRTDPHENENLTNNPEHAGLLKDLVATLHKKLRARW